jgi:hypothetical protein
VGAIFLNVPIVFVAPRLPAVTVQPDGGLRTHELDAAWRSAPDVQRDQGIPVLVRAKLRPVLVLRVGAVLLDAVHHRSVWVAPLYGETDPPRGGPNIFPLPAWPAARLPFAGYVDFYEASMIPLPHLQAERYSCELSDTATKLLLGAISSWADADPPVRAR